MEKIKALIENLQKNILAVIAAIAALITSVVVLTTSLSQDAKALKATIPSTNEIVTNK
jgi:hypothetical protein